MRRITPLCILMLLAAPCGATQQHSEPTVSGRVADADTGVPLAGVYLWLSLPPPLKAETLDRAISGENGEFSMTVAPGEVDLHWRVDNPLYERNAVGAPLRVTVSQAGASGLVVKIPRLQVATGRVRGAGGEPVSGARVTVGPPGSNVGAITDNRGRFAVILPSQRSTSPGCEPPGTKGNTVVLLAVDSDGKLGAVTTVDRSRIRSDDLQIVLSKPRKLAVIVKGPDGNPMAGIRVWFEAVYGSVCLGWGAANTDNRGEVTFDGLWEGGTYAPSVRAEDLTAPNCRVYVAGQDWSGNVELNLEPPVRVQEGVVVDAEGKPVPNASVYAMAMKHSRTDSDEEGRFALTGLPNAPVEIRAYRGHARGSVTAGRDAQEVVVKLDR